MKAAKWALFAAAMLAAGVTAAQEREHDLLIPIGMSAEVGGGVGGFTDTRATDVSKVAGTWSARLVIGTRSVLGGEVAYIGTAQGMNALGLDDKAVLVSNGAEGLLRLNAMTGMFQPYVFAGLSIKHYQLTNEAFNTSSVNDKDDVGEFPVGVGFSVRVGRIIADIRATYRQAFDSTLLGHTPLNNWGAGAKVGFEF